MGIESRWDQLSRCDRDSDCCSKKCNIFRDSAYHCEPSTQNGVSGTEGTGQVRGGCIQDGAKCGPGNHNCCNSHANCHAVPYKFLHELRCATCARKRQVCANHWQCCSRTCRWERQRKSLCIASRTQFYLL